MAVTIAAAACTLFAVTPSSVAVSTYENLLRAADAESELHPTWAGSGFERRTYTSVGIDPAAKGGGHVLWASRPGAEIEQSVDVASSASEIDGAMRTLIVEARLGRSADADPATRSAVRVEALDAQGTPVGNVLRLEAPEAAGAVFECSVGDRVPAGTRSVRVRLSGDERAVADDVLVYLGWQVPPHSSPPVSAPPAATTPEPRGVCHLPGAAPVIPAPPGPTDGPVTPPPLRKAAPPPPAVVPVPPTIETWAAPAARPKVRRVMLRRSRVHVWATAAQRATVTVFRDESRRPARRLGVALSGGRGSRAIGPLRRGGRYRVVVVAHHGSRSSPAITRTVRVAR